MPHAYCQAVLGMVLEWRKDAPFLIWPFEKPFTYICSFLIVLPKPRTQRLECQEAEVQVWQAGERRPSFMMLTSEHVGL
jgi:hypothetical protein